MNIIKASGLDNALNLLKEGAKVLAGGTNVFVDLKKKGEPKNDYIDISDIKELQYIKEEDGLKIGALATFSQIEDYLKTRTDYQAIYQAAFNMGAPQIRNRATVAGNICDASPASDSSPALLVSGAKITVLSTAEKRETDIKDFFTGFRKTALKCGEMVTEISLEKREKSFYKKVGLRNALAISVVSLAGSVNNGRVELAMGSVAPMPIRLFNCEEYVNGNKELFAKGLKEALKKDISPISDIRATKEYRERVALNLLIDSLKKEFGYAIV